MIFMLIKGFIIGVFVSAPVGPIGMLCMQRTLNKGRSHGFATALGAMVSDLIYAIIVVFSMSVIIERIKEYSFALQITGSIIVALFGLYIFLSNPVKKLTKFNAEKKNHIQDFLTSLVLTITNPLVILLFIALFAKFSYIPENTDFKQNILGVLFVMLGAFFWWILLVNVVNLFRSRINMRRLYVVNRSTGIIFVLIGIVTLGFALFS